MGRRAHRIDDTQERGAALVEAAIILPILLLVVFGIVAFARAYNAKTTLTHAAREGVRELAITGDPVAAETVAKDAATSLDPDQMTVTVTACVPGNPVQLTIQYPFSYDIPVFGSRSLTLTETGVMRCGG
jgi:Flp pilus assembly protein TadG